jgi:lipopolysaccharide/colanic/teichoic acid biosynthesis glycosyltransferase
MVHDRARADLAYLDHQSLAYDLSLLFRQAAAIARRLA